MEAVRGLCRDEATDATATQFSGHAGSNLQAHSQPVQLQGPDLSLTKQEYLCMPLESCCTCPIRIFP